MAIDTSKFSSEFSDLLRTSVEKSEVAKLVKKEKPKKKSKSYKPLKFEVRDDITPLKRAIIEQFNKRDYTYDALKEYYEQFIKDDPDADNHGAYNLIGCLKDRRGMSDKTISILLDFLEMDILFVSRNSDTVLASAYDLVSRLQNCPERLAEIIDLLKTEVGKDEEREEEVE